MVARSIIITGGFGTVGLALGRRALAAGWRVALVDRADTPPQVDGALLLPGTDLIAPGAAESMVQAVVRAFGGVDALANVAGGFTWQPVAQTTAADWERMFAINLSTAFAASHAVLAHLSAGGAIVNVGAYAALRAEAGMGPYTAAKSAVHRLTEALAAEQRAAGVRVNAVLPSIVDTPQNRSDMPGADRTDWVSPEALADAILFLSGDGARAVTGALLPLTGGSRD